MQDRIKDLNPYLLPYIESITQASPKDGKGKFVCPLCGSGSGGGTAAFSYWINPANNRAEWSCFSCGERGDILDLYQAVNGCDKRTAIENLAARFLGESQPLARQKPVEVQATQEESKATKWMRSQYQSAPAIAPNTRAAEYLAKRGISLATASAFSLKGNDRFIFYPSHGTDFVHARAIGEGDNMPKFHIGSPKPFNFAVMDGAEKPVFVVEGQADALSLAEVGVNAVALCSTSNVRDFIKQLKAAMVYPQFVLMLDNDATGQKAEDSLLKGLILAGYDAICLDREEWGYTDNDPNDWLIRDRDSLARLAAIDYDYFEAKFVDRVEQHPIEKSDLSEPDYFAAEQQALMDHDKAEEETKRYNSKSARDAFANWVPSSFADNETDIDAAIAEEVEVISTGFPSLDSVLKGGGLSKGLYLFGAPPATGKSAFCLQIADHIASMGHKVLYYSLEMSAAELKTRTLARLTKVLSMDRDGDPDKNIIPLSLSQVEKVIRYGQKAEHPALFKSYDRIKSNLYGEYFDKSKPTAEVIEAQIDKFAAMFADSKPVVVIDYLQLIRLENPKQDSDVLQRLSDISTLLKRLSNLCPILVISSVNRASYKEVSLGSFKGSGDLEFSANFAAVLTVTDEADTRERELSLCVVKSRAGMGNVDIKFKFYGENLWFKDLGQVTRHGEETTVKTVEAKPTGGVVQKKLSAEEAKEMFG